MSRTAVELAEARVGAVSRVEDGLAVMFSHMFVYRGRSLEAASRVWSDEGVLHLRDGVVVGDLPALPGTVFEGCLVVGGVPHEALPLPFHRRAAAELRLVMDDGSVLELHGTAPRLDLRGKGLPIS